MQGQRNTRVNKTVAPALYNHRVSIRAPRLAAARGIVIERDLLRQRQPVALAHWPDALGVKFAAGQSARFGRPPQIVDDSDEPADGDAEGGEGIGDREGHGCRWTAGGSAAMRQRINHFGV